MGLCSVSGPQRIAGYEDIIDDAARELDRVNERLTAANMQYQRMQAKLNHLESQATAEEGAGWQVCYTNLVCRDVFPWS